MSSKFAKQFITACQIEMFLDYFPLDLESAKESLTLFQIRENLGLLANRNSYSSSFSNESIFKTLLGSDGQTPLMPVAALYLVAKYRLKVSKLAHVAKAV